MDSNHAAENYIFDNSLCNHFNDSYCEVIRDLTASTLAILPPTGVLRDSGGNKGSCLGELKHEHSAVILSPTGGPRASGGINGSRSPQTNDQDVIYDLFAPVTTLTKGSGVTSAILAPTGDLVDLVSGGNKVSRSLDDNENICVTGYGGGSGFHLLANSDSNLDAKSSRDETIESMESMSKFSNSAVELKSREFSSSDELDISASETDIITTTASNVSNVTNVAKSPADFDPDISIASSSRDEVISKHESSNPRSFRHPTNWI